MKYIRKYTLESDWEDDQQDREANVPVTSWLVDVDEVRYDHEEDPATRLVLTSTNNPEVFTILDEAGFEHNRDNGYTVAELAEITNEDFYNIAYDSEGNDVYYSIFFNSDIETFDEFQYFTGITIIQDYAFSGCANLSSIVLPNSIVAINGCSGNNTYIDIGDGEERYSYYSPFQDTNLTSITIPNSVTSIGYNTFYNCYRLTSVTIPNSVTSIGYSAFQSCGGLTSVTVPNSVTSIGNRAFANCNGLTSIVVDSGNIIYDSRNNCNAIIETATNTLLSGCKNTIIPNSVTSIGYGAFSGCLGLTSVNIPNSVTTININAFSSCQGLTSVTIGNSVTSISGGAFTNCIGLNTITSLARTAPNIISTTFQYIKTGGTLHVPSGADYSTWMSSSNYYLGKYNWTIAYDA